MNRRGGLFLRSTCRLRCSGRWNGSCWDSDACGHCEVPRAALCARQETLSIQNGSIVTSDFDECAHWVLGLIAIDATSLICVNDISARWSFHTIALNQTYLFEYEFIYECLSSFGVFAEYEALTYALWMCSGPCSVRLAQSGLIANQSEVLIARVPGQFAMHRFLRVKLSIQEIRQIPALNA